MAVPTTLHTGRARFRVINTGTVTHELLVFRSNLPPSRYPVDRHGRIREDAPGITKISDGANLPPGGSQRRNVDLTKPGTYLFVCNLPHHFERGMYTQVTVTN